MQGLNFSQIAKLLHHPSSISREWKRHTKENIYSPNKAQKSYHIAKSHCRRKWILEIDHNLSNTVKHLFLNYQWSPEEMEGRFRLEYGKAVISYQTIYRPFTESMLKTEGKSPFLIRFTKDPKKRTSELGPVIGKQVRLQGKLEKHV